MRAVARDASASYAVEVARLLWPEPWGAPYVTRTRDHNGRAHRDVYLFPSRRRPRLLVPADVPGSSSMLQRLGPGRSAVVRPVRGLLQRSVHARSFALARWPVLRVVAADPDADSIEQHLADVMGTPVRVGIMLGTRRVNQKPVLQVFDLDGRLLAYAKVGHNELTAALVRREAAALQRLHADPPRWCRVPRVVYHGQWGGLALLVTTPMLPEPGVRGVPRQARVNAMLEVAGLDGARHSTLQDSGFWRAMRAEVTRIAPEPGGAELARLADRIEDRDGRTVVQLGCWHGDWSRWNMNLREGIVQIWDWERYDAEVPWGLDALHLAAHVVRPAQGDPRQQERELLESVPTVLGELGVAPAEHDLTLRLYLATIGVRYLDALSHSATPALRRRMKWVLDLLERLS